jgi:hypothetical protein
LRFPPNDTFVEAHGHGININRICFYRFSFKDKSLKVWFAGDRLPTTFDNPAIVEKMYLAIHANAFDISQMDVESLRKALYPNKKE